MGLTLMRGGKKEKFMARTDGEKEKGRKNEPAEGRAEVKTGLFEAADPLITMTLTFE